MGNITAPSIEYYKSFADEMQGKFRRVNQLTPHGPSIGNYHEEIVRSVLRNFLSKRFSVITGFIYGEEGKVSSQIDILIVDENSPIGYVFQEGDFAIVMPEAVAAVVEVKSTIDCDTFDESIDKIATVKSFNKFPSSITGIIFSFDGGTKNDKTIASWLTSKTCKKFKDKKELAPDTIMFFMKEVMLLPHSEIPNQAPPLGIYKRLTSLTKNGDIKAAQLSILLALIVNACIRKDTSGVIHRFPVVQANRLFQAEEVDVTSTKFSIGEGIVNGQKNTVRQKTPI